ncbi:uncharacterized protein A1O9_05268 [Exophiala aquamarina CBS 119918]|uniref:Uncharacterized protein n=1 Tax=Exophiala aquamarina CBS 119918 TaxID=1182545 RepID=A0A072PBY3_9EURO|nr:uncharacterized protein A1O9_05268 [Exophiala aquamarina CBS 119918]KEF57351.1 hypothetical protein A1O9_05268 [Exophiala aquamarina CBS 119918]
MLRGLKHRQILHFHQVYVKAYRDRKGFLRSSKIESIQGAINNLLNCHDIILSDDYDLQTGCKDSDFRVGILSHPDLLNKLTTWGLRPQMWEWTNEPRDSLLAVGDIFQALQGCFFITSLTIDFWAAHWNEIHGAIKYEYIGNPSSRRFLRTELKYPHIHQLEFKVRFCEFLWNWVKEPSIQSTLKHVIGCTDSFPELQELSFAPSFSEPEQGYVEYFQLRSESIDDDGGGDDDIALNTRFNPTTTATERVTRDALAQGLTDTVLNCMYAELLPTTFPLPKLRTVRFSNATLDMRLLLYWLASHKQLPSSSISIHLLETTIFHGLNPGLFLEALAQLNV